MPATERPVIANQLDTARNRLADARAMLDAYDRPLHRRKHRSAIDEAKKVVDQLPGRIVALEDDTAAIDRAIPELTARITDLEAAVEQIPDLSNEYNEKANQLERSGADTKPVARTCLDRNFVGGTARPSNRDLIEALERTDTSRPGRPDLGIEI